MFSKLNKLLYDLETIIKRYKETDTWLSNSYIDELLFENLEDVIIESGTISEYVPFADLVDNAYKK